MAVGFAILILFLVAGIRHAIAFTQNFELAALPLYPVRKGDEISMIAFPKTTRRFFLERLIASAGLNSLGVTVRGTPRLRFGVVSDIHFTTSNTDQYFLNAITWFRSQNVDAVMITGDLADTGQYTELERVAACWYQVFPNDTGLNGRHVEKLFIYGNHDYEGWTYNASLTEQRRPYALINDWPGYWETYFHEPFQPVYSKTIKGYTFIGMHWGKQTEMREFVAQLAPTLPTDRPFFFFQHAHPWNTIYGEWAWGAWDDKKAATESLTPYPQAVAFSGHSHYSLTDERGIWQGAFTSLGTASTRYIGHPYGPENAGTDNSALDLHMPRMNDSYPQGMLVSVYHDVMVIARREFAYGESVGPDWVVPLPTLDQPDRPFSFVPRAAVSYAPQFAANAIVTLTQRTGTTRKGRSEQQVVVGFPRALFHDYRDRIYTYEVTVEILRYQTVIPYRTKTVYAEKYFLSDDRIAASGTLVFGVNELPANEKIRFAVRPQNCFGKTGAPIYSAVIDSPGTKGENPPQGASEKTSAAISVHDHAASSETKTGRDADSRTVETDYAYFSDTRLDPGISILIK
ncbi:MAG: metallophosphoesterase [Kiritimatiellae bacterium]|nr:metallophosphoesterase [Kiritimatiellia bacterium]